MKATQNNTANTAPISKRLQTELLHKGRTNTAKCVHAQLSDY